jgi:predicted DNA repair protein MutK
MATGLIALLDDVAALAKVAAASIDDTVAAAAKAGVKVAGVVIDDAAVTPRYVTGFAAARELPIVAQIARGSLKNKLLYLLPAGLALSAFAPWSITPLLMAGGGYLCFEGAEKVHELVAPHADTDPVDQPAALGPDEVEKTMVAGAIRTDLILSAEIMAIALATVAEESFVTQVVILVVIAVAITVGVYGAVALIVKADDAGVVLARSRSGALRAVGRGLVSGMPAFLKALGAIGTAAMLWVGGSILLHGVEGYGLVAPARLIREAAASAGHRGGPIVEWLVGAGASGIVGIAIGAAIVALVTAGRRKN